LQPLPGSSSVQLGVAPDAGLLAVKVATTDGGVVPPTPVAGLVTGDQQDRSSYRLEGEEDTDLA